MGRATTSTRFPAFMQPSVTFAARVPKLSLKTSRRPGEMSDDASGKWWSLQRSSWIGRHSTKPGHMKKYLDRLWKYTTNTLFVVYFHVFKQRPLKTELFLCCCFGCFNWEKLTFQFQWNVLKVWKLLVFDTQQRFGGIFCLWNSNNDEVSNGGKS